MSHTYFHAKQQLNARNARMYAVYYRTVGYTVAEAYLFIFGKVMPK